MMQIIQGIRNIIILLCPFSVPRDSYIRNMEGADLTYWSRIIWIPHPNFKFNMFEDTFLLNKPYFFEVLRVIETPFKILARMKTGKSLPSKKFKRTILFRVKASKDLSLSKWQRKFILRFTQTDGKVDKVDVLPAQLHIVVNDKPCRLPYLPPIDITEFCYLSEGALNRLTVSWTKGTEEYSVSILEGRRATPFYLAKNLIRNIPVDFARAFRLLSKVTLDSGTQKNSTLVSLKCPFSYKRMVIPVRSIFCEHLQCFDVFSYITHNERRPTWKCPLCDKFAPIQSLVMDGFLKEVLKSPELKDAYRILMYSDGSWEPHYVEEDPPESDFRMLWWY